MAQRVEMFSDEFDSETHKKMKETVRGVKGLDDRALWLYLKDLAYKSNRHFDFREVPVDLCTHFVVDHFKSNMGDI